MVLPNEALTWDGYINKQEKIIGLLYGASTINKHGCGPIAAYNALITLGKKHPFESVLKYFEKTSVKYIQSGTTVLQILGFMRLNGIRVKLHFNNYTLENKSKGIIWYKSKNGWHYVTYVSNGSIGNYNFYNAGGEYGPVVETMGDFLKKYSTSKIYTIFELKGA